MPGTYRNSHKGSCAPCLRPHVQRGDRATGRVLTKTKTKTPPSPPPSLKLAQMWEGVGVWTGPGGPPVLKLIFRLPLRDRGEGLWACT